MWKRSRDSCKKLFKELKILPLQSQYILSLLLFVTHNKNNVNTNQELYTLNTMQKKWILFI